MLPMFHNNANAAQQPLGPCRRQQRAGQFAVSTINDQPTLSPPPDYRLRTKLTPLKLKTFGKLPVIGGKDCQSVTQTPAHGETFRIGERIAVTALHTPCHTQDSICYFMQDGDQKVVFTGDTLFIGGELIPIPFG